MKVYYEIIQLTQDNHGYLEDLTNTPYWILRGMAMNRIKQGAMKNNMSNVIHFIKDEYNRILREKGINARVI